MNQVPDRPVRQLHLNAFLMGTGHHEASWRHPRSNPELAVTAGHYVNIAQIAERGGLDSVFFADSVSVGRNLRFNGHTNLEPITLVSAIAACTERIGLIVTASTTYGEPFTVARQFASLDHISSGRAGWNIVTSADRDEALNFNRLAPLPHAERYARATEFVQVVRALWDSWQDGARVMDKAGAVAVDTDRVHPIDHAGGWFTVRGPLNVARPPQGHPMLVQAGSSDTGRDYAARFADAVFTAQPTLSGARSFYRDLKERAAGYGRDPGQVVILPGVVPFVGSTEAEARRLLNELAELTNPEYGRAQLSRMLEIDLTGHPLDAPLPPLPPVERIQGGRSRFALIKELAEAGLSTRQISGRLAAGRGHRVLIGTPEQVADDLEHWFRTDAADGFNLMAPLLPTGLETFVDQVVPLLRRRGIFRHEYTSSTLRGHYGLARVPDRSARPA